MRFPFPSRTAPLLAAPLLAAFLAVLAAGGAGAARADPQADSCRFLDVVATNRSEAVPDLIEAIGAAWTATNRAALTEKFTAITKGIPMQGGSVWRVARFGEDLEEHLLLLRLTSGELAGMRLRYEAAVTGAPRLVAIAFEREVPALYKGGALPATAEALSCPSG